MRWKKYAPIAAIIISGIICYFNSLHGDFIWDDNFLIKNNPRITHWRFIPEIFSKTIGSKTQSQEMFWRPLQILSYSVDYHLWKYNVTGYHAVNVLLHIAVALCLYWLILIIFNSSLVAGFCAILFTVHPIQTATVSYISARADQLTALFILLSYIIYLKSERTKNIFPYIFMMISFVLALLAKENALVLPLLLLLYHFVFRKKIAVKEFSSLAVLSAIYLIMRLSVLKTTALNPATLGSALDRLPGFFIALATYFRLLILPFNLHAAYGRELFSFADPAAIIGILVSLGLLAYSFIKRKSNPLILFSTGWFFLAILPTSNIYPISFYMAEHFLYVPGIGFFLIAGSFFAYLYTSAKTRNSAVVIIIAVSMVYAFLTIRQNNYWKEPVAFYQRTLQFSPNEPRLYNNLAEEYFKRGDYRSALVHVTKAISIDPRFPGSHCMAAACYYRLGETARAKDLLERFIATDTSYAPAYYMLGSMYSQEGVIQRAIDCFRGSINASKEYADAYYSQAILYRNILQPQAALAILRDAILNCPDDPRLPNLQGLVYQDIAKYEEAIASFKRAITLDKGFGSAYNNLAALYFHRNKYKLAHAFALKAVRAGYKVNPDFLEDLRKQGFGTF